ncbi:MAG TPA: NAD(P)/FAD-dependent oxidoreductase [Burkholderiaceae bacterium]|nr:NAD(P)/FAD-dependent oxidoreductase [Burkholderiaceae bacterium]
MESIQTVVVGAGVIGLAVARALARSGREVIIVEANDAVGAETSSRNSEVIHAGIYYAPGSLKAKLCVEGRERLYGYCDERHVAYRNCGKLIVASEQGQLDELERVAHRAENAGVENLRWLDATQAKSLEPALRCEHALLSPSTGIIDSHGLMLAYLGEAEDYGAMLARKSHVSEIECRGGEFILRVEVAGELHELSCRELVNAAGLGANALAQRIEGLEPEHIPPLYLAKGSYFSLATRCPFSRLIYPVPNEAGLGVHLTLDLAGQGRFGPDVEWTDALDYRVDPARCAGFYEEIRTYWPGLPDGALQPAYSGIRPKLVAAGEPAADFRIDGPERHGVPGLVNVFGIESPGLTASLAIADRVSAALAG